MTPGAALVAALLVTVFLAVGLAGLSGAWATWGTGILFSIGAMMVGALLGFLFGIPRSLQAENRTDQQAGGGTGKYLVNTNLEQISDWLTKILVGVGLIQLREILGGINQLITATSGAFGGGAQGQVTAGALLTFWSIGGFLAGYVVTRTTLTRVFARFDPSDVRSIVDAQMTERLQRDGEAMRLVLQQVDDDAPAVDFATLREALAHASPGGRANILVLAEEIRRKTWRHREYKPQLNRTVLVFKALTEVSPDSHRYWANYGFVLKDQEPPDNDGALAALDMAIQTRGDPMTWGSEAYEFARALVCVRKYTGAPPDEETRQIIFSDVAVALSNKSILRRIERAMATQLSEADAADREIHLLKPYIPGTA